MGMLNRIFNEDNLATMQRIPDGKIDLILTSPPYADMRSYNGFSWSFEKMLPEMFRIVKPGGVVVWVVGDKTHKGSEMLEPFTQALAFKAAGFLVHDTMIWTAERPPKTHRRYEQKFEFMFVFSKGVPSTFNPIMERCVCAGDTHRHRYRHDGTDLRDAHGKNPVATHRIKGNVWKCHVGGGSAETKRAHEHPAIFPLQLAVDHVKSWTNPGDVVYDPFMGSGTTAIAAIKTKRRYIGSEISSDYCNLISARVTAFLKRPQGLLP